MAWWYSCQSVSHYRWSWFSDLLFCLHVLVDSCILIIAAGVLRS
jgi:hypothetical protein